MKKHSIHVQARLHDSLYLSAWQRRALFPSKCPTIFTPFLWKSLTQGSSLLVEKRERNTDGCEARHFGFKDALASASSCPAFSDAVLDAVCHALQSSCPLLLIWGIASLQASKKNSCWIEKCKHVAITAYLHDLRGHRSPRFLIVPHRKSIEIIHL